MRSRSFLLYVLFLLTISRSAVRAADVVWTNASSGNWATAANWSPNQVPGAGDNAFITNNGTYTVTVNANTTVNSMTVGGTSGAQTLTLTSGTLTVGAGSDVGAQGVFSLAGGTLTGAGDLTIRGVFNWSSGSLTGNGRTIRTPGPSVIPMRGTRRRQFDGWHQGSPCGRRHCMS